MTHNDGYWKFTNSISKLVRAAATKDPKPASSHKHLDALLEEEYETLLREIDYLTSEQSCYLSFKNEAFSKGKSSQELSNILTKHSEEVLKTYIEKQGKSPGRNALKTQDDLVNYVTKIVVSKPPCNHKLCTCKPRTASKEVVTGLRVSKDTGQATQSSYSADKSTETRPQRPRILIKTPPKPAQQATEIQTESRKDPEPQTASRSVSTEAKKLQHASTSDKKVTASKSILTNCTGETIETQTTKLCVPQNFESLLTSPGQFSSCSGKQDCGCGAVDAQRASKMGLAPVDGQARKGKVSSGEVDSVASTPRSNAPKAKKETTGCFGSKKKRRQCDEYCQGIAARPQSVQTLPITTKDKSEHIRFHEEKTSTPTSTDSEVGVQVSSSPSGEDWGPKPQQDKGVSLREEKEVGRDSDQPAKAKKSRDQEGNTCNKCGRQKRNCDSACRNTIIIPYATGSNGGIPAGEAESLRMLIKMQSRDTSRQFDGILAELNHHKDEIKRLNSMYKKMVDSAQLSQKSDEKSKKSSGASNGGPSRRFGPPNTAVAINMCDTCTVKISPNSITTACGSKDQDYFDGDKHRKNELNRTKRASQDILPSTDFSEGADLLRASAQDSLSTIYGKFSKPDSNIRKKEGHLSLLNGQEEEDEEDGLMGIPRLNTKADDQNPKRLPSSRVLIWLKKSWVTIRHRTEECGQKERERQEKSKLRHQVWNFCQSSAKKVAVNAWKCKSFLGIS
ncbi:hypothetical protein HUJ04_006317 [Dendroctonus ponderosae]|nr:hypothetical protein HUJ04_006317 [Dendroctonus ponderosae]